MNRKLLVVIYAVLLISSISSAAAYTNYYIINNAQVDVNNSTFTINNSTIILGENNTIVTPPPSATSTPTPSPTSTPTPAPTPTPVFTNAPQITSVSPISADQSQTITIKGVGFGNIQPHLMSLGDGSVDTVWGGSTPSIVVYDLRNKLSAGAAGEWFGFTRGSPDLIGVILVSWADTEIVIGGFGSGLGSQFSWSQVSPEDALQIQVQTVGGFATYDTVAI